jgi:hypothetical protein
MAALSTIHDVTGRRLVSSIYSWDINASNSFFVNLLVCCSQWIVLECSQCAHPTSRKNFASYAPQRLRASTFTPPPPHSLGNFPLPIYRQLYHSMPYSFIAFTARRIYTVPIYAAYSLPLCLLLHIWKVVLKTHWHEKSVSNKYIGGCIRPSIWAATLFKDFLVDRLKGTILKMCILSI